MIKNQFDGLVKPFYKYKDGYYANLEKDRLNTNYIQMDTIKFITEQRRLVIRMTESDLHNNR